MYKNIIKKSFICLICITLIALISGCSSNKKTTKKELYKLTIEEYILKQKILFYENDFKDNSLVPPADINVFIELNNDSSCMFSRKTINYGVTILEQSYSNDCHYSNKDRIITINMKVHHMEWLNSDSRDFTRDYYEELNIRGSISENKLFLSLIINNQEFLLNNKQYVSLNEKGISQVLYNPENGLTYDLNGNSIIDYEGSAGEKGLNHIDVSKYEIKYDNNDKESSKTNNKTKKSDKKEPINVETVDEIKDFGYSISNIDTTYYKKEFYKLNDILKAEPIDNKKYAEYVARMFVNDLYTMSTKVNKYDVGGIEYYHVDDLDGFSNKVKDTIYKNIIDDTYGDRDQELPEVKEIETISVNETTYNMNNNTIKAYEVKLKWTYVKDMGYDNQGTVIVVQQGESKKWAVVDYQPKI